MEKNILYLGMPILLLIISLSLFIFVGVEVKKRRLEIKDIVVWFLLNVVFTTIVLYILIIEVLLHLNISKAVNAFNWIAQNAFGLDMNGQEWIMIMILSFIAFILNQLIINSVRVQRINKRLDDLAKETAILGGKVNKTVDVGKLNIARHPKSKKELKRELKIKIKENKNQTKEQDNLI